MRRHVQAFMGTAASVIVPVAAHDAVHAVWALFAEWEATLSRFLADSELSRLNARAGEERRVSRILYRVVEESLAGARATGGLFDPTLRRQVEAAGYDVSFERLAGRPPIRPGRTRPGGAWRRVRTDPDRLTVTLPAGCGIDVGGIAKGMAVDEALAVLAGRGIDRALVDLGGDLAVAGLPPDQTAWTIALPTPGRALSVPLCRGALATSGVSRRHWPVHGGEAHHLIDPRTGRPAAGDLLTVTVAAGRCSQAEVAAKAAFLLGADAGAAWLTAVGLSGLFVDRQGRLTPAGRWPAAMAPAS